VVPTEVGARAGTATEDTLLLKVHSRTWRPVPRPLSCPA
jgi:hypothetical protein